MRLSIIILNYNSASDCQKCIYDLKQQRDVETEIFLVDNCSQDEDRLIVKQLCEENNCFFIQCKENRGYNAGNNAGLRYAANRGHKYALIVNPDMEFPQHNYLLKMIDTIERDDRIAICGSDIITPKGVHQNPLRQETTSWRGIVQWVREIFARGTKGQYSFIDDYQTSHYCQKVSGCCLLVRLSFVKEIGYFDEYPLLFCEEAILSQQVMRLERWKMYYLHSAQAVHNHKDNDKADRVARLRQWQRSRSYFIKKYSGYGKLRQTLSLLSMRLYIVLLIIKSYARRQ